MELEIEEQDKNYIIVKVKGETMTLLKLIKEELWNDKDVSEAAIIQEHPFMSDPKILVKVKSGNPITALEKSVDRVKENIEKFRKAFNKALGG
jgi:DNA-directed RNA polymerase subunit L